MKVSGQEDHEIVEIDKTVFLDELSKYSFRLMRREPERFEIIERVVFESSVHWALDEGERAATMRRKTGHKGDKGDNA